MENNNTKMIRHFINLMESVNNKILSDNLQDEKNTLEEQAQLAGKLLGSLRGLQNADEIAKNAAIFTGVKGIKNYDDLVNALATMNEIQKNQVVKSLIQTVPDYANLFRAELMTLDDFVKAVQNVYPDGIAGQVNRQKEAIIMKTLKAYGYSDDVARDMIRKTAERAGRKTPDRLAGQLLRDRGPKGGTQKPKKTQVANQAKNAAEEIPVVTAEEIKMSRFKKLLNGTKQFVWNNKWGVATGALLLGAWWLWSRGGKDEVKIVNPDGQDITPVAPETKQKSKYIPTGKNECVIKIQTFLKNQKIDLGNTGPNGDGVDGIYGPKTVAAVQTFQGKFTDLNADGIWGPLTAAKTGNQVLPCGVTPTTTNQAGATTTQTDTTTTPSGIRDQANRLINVDQSRLPGLNTDVSQFDVQ
jgi:hypothetical protein